MCGLFYTWHGWIALAVMLAAGFGTLYRWRYLLEQWMIGLGAAAVLLLGVSAGHLVSHYEGTVQGAGMMRQVSSGRMVTRVPAIV